jgi:hypothetical protein
MIKNILEDIVFIEPIEGLPIGEGMCVNCGCSDAEIVTEGEEQ